MSGFTFIIERCDAKQVQLLDQAFTVHDDYFRSEDQAVLEFAAVGATMGLWGHGRRQIDSDTQRCRALHALLQRVKEVPIDDIEAAFPEE